MDSPQSKINLVPVYFLGLFFAFHVAIGTYINSSFLQAFVSEDFVGTIYTISSIIAILFLVFLPKLLRIIGNYRLAQILLFLEVVALLSLVFIQNSIVVIVAFILSWISVSLFYYSTDIFLEGASADRATGRIRGLYLTAVNFGWAVAPFVTGYFIGEGNYRNVYAISLALLIPSIFILFKYLRKFEDSEYEADSLSFSIKEILYNRDLRNIFGANFLLNFFYSVMVIYTPIYLHSHIGLSWQSIAFIFSIMLLPFIFIQFPLGILADKYIGEKEILFGGFLIMIISTASLYFIPATSSILLWALVLFFTRVGAASVEVMSAVYFFKKVSNLNSDTIGLFRMSSPLSYITAPVIFSFVLAYFDLKLGYIFLILAAILMLGLYFSLRIKDTR
jgi:MFS family permease